MKRLIILAGVGLLFGGCSSGTPEIRRLHPVVEAAPAPRECRLISVLPDSVGQKAGLKAGEIVRSVNGVSPKDAAGFSDLINQSKEDAVLAVVDSSGTTRSLQVRLRAERPRLGVVCDLTGWRKPGLTPAGNESLTVFQGPYALTASGIIDKGILFMRVRVANNSLAPLKVGPALFRAEDGTAKKIPLLSPKQVMCALYGDKGAHLLALKKRRKETPDTDSFSNREPLSDDSCTGMTGRLSSDDPRYADANAEYVAMESLWTAPVNPGGVADGLIYMTEPSAMPVNLKAVMGDQTLQVALGQPLLQTQANVTPMKESTLVDFFEAQKRGAALRLTLRKGRVFVGKFASFDPVEERVWFDTPHSGLLNSTSFPITSIRTAEPIEQVPSQPQPSDRSN